MFVFGLLSDILLPWPAPCASNTPELCTRNPEARVLLLDIRHIFPHLTSFLVLATLRSGTASPQRDT